MDFPFLFSLSCLSNRWTIDVGWTSTWVRVGNEWLAALIYGKKSRENPILLVVFSVCIAPKMNCDLIMLQSGCWLRLWYGKG